MDPNASSSKQDDGHPPGFIDFLHRRSMSDESHDIFSWSCPEQDDAHPPGFVDFFNRRSMPDELHNKQSENKNKNLKQDQRLMLDESHNGASSSKQDDGHPPGFIDFFHQRSMLDESHDIWSCPEHDNAHPPGFIDFFNQRSMPDELHNKRLEEIEKLELKCQSLSERFERLQSLSERFERLSEILNRHLENEKKNSKEDQGSMSDESHNRWAFGK